MSPISGNGLCLFISWPLFFLLFCFLNFHERRQHVWWSGMKRKAESRLADCVSPALMKRMLQWLQQSAEEETRSSGDCQQPNDLQCLLRRLARNANYHILTLVCDSVSVRTRGCSCSATLSVSAVMTSPNSRSAERRWGCVTCSSKLVLSQMSTCRDGVGPKQKEIRNVTNMWNCGRKLPRLPDSQL